MKRLEIEPSAFPCKLIECPAGFFVFNNSLCFKSEYFTAEGAVEAFCDSGEMFWGGVSTVEEQRDLIVLPVQYVWVGG